MITNEKYGLKKIKKNEIGFFDDGYWTNDDKYVELIIANIQERDNQYDDKEFHIIVEQHLYYINKEKEEIWDNQTFTDCILINDLYH